MFDVSREEQSMSHRRTRLRGLKVFTVAGAVSAALLVVAGSAVAATHPDGGHGFDTGVEGWSSGATSCTPVELLCTSEADHDATAGNPPGSLAVETTATVNLISLFKGTATWTSPQFTIPVEPITDARLHLDNAFDPGALVDVDPVANYAVTLADLTTGTSTTVLSKQLDEADTAFSTASAPVAVVGGHRYQLSVNAEIAQSTLALSVVSGTTSLNLDNVGIAVQSSAGGQGDGDKDGSDRRGESSSLSDRRLFSLLRDGTTASPVVLKGKRLFVKVNCPAKIDRACRIVAQGMLTRRKPATQKRTVKVGKGKSKRIVLRIMPKARAKLTKRKRLLVRQKVRAGKAQATIYQQRKLIRR
jgi:hypothetical protein